MAGQRTTKSILQDAEQTLVTARMGLADACGSDPLRRVPGVMNVVVFGRAVTNVLQNLRSTEPTFDDWYTPFVVEMREDPLLRYLYNLRSELLKQGQRPTSVNAVVNQFDSSDMSAFGPPPAGALGFFIGDRHGGTGWDVQLPDGSVTQFYVQMPAHIGVATVHLPEAPTRHLGGDLRDTEIGTICRAYVTYLDNMLAAARARFD